MLVRVQRITIFGANSPCIYTWSLSGYPEVHHLRSEDAPSGGTKAEASHLGAI